MLIREYKIQKVLMSYPCERIFQEMLGELSCQCISRKICIYWFPAIISEYQHAVVLN
jgi:hypothetical protein